MFSEMPCNIDAANVEYPQIIEHIDTEEDEEDWVEADPNGGYMQLDGSDVMDTGMFSDESDNESDDNLKDMSRINQSDDNAENQSDSLPTLDINDEQVDRVLHDMLDAEPVSCAGISFPDPPRDKELVLSPEAEESRKKIVELTDVDEAFIKLSMNSINLPPPNWATSVPEENWKEQLKLHLSKTDDKL